MRYVFFIIAIALISGKIVAQTVRYSPAWFGPNANPVPEFKDATITDKTTLELMGDYYFGFEDQTQNAYIKIDVNSYLCFF